MTRSPLRKMRCSKRMQGNDALPSPYYLTGAVEVSREVLVACSVPHSMVSDGPGEMAHTESAAEGESEAPEEEHTE